MGFFKLQRGVNAMQIEAGDCWCGFRGLGSTGCVLPMTPAAAAPAAGRRRAAVRAVPLSMLIVTSLFPWTCDTALPAPAAPVRYAVPTWQDEQDVRSGKKVRGLFKTRTMEPACIKQSTILLLRRRAQWLSCPTAGHHVGRPSKGASGLHHLMHSLSPLQVLAFSLPACVAAGHHVGIFDKEEAVHHLSHALLNFSHTPLFALQLGTMWGIFDKDEAERIIPEGHRRPHFE